MIHNNYSEISLSEKKEVGYIIHIGNIVEIYNNLCTHTHARTHAHAPYAHTHTHTHIYFFKYL